MERFSLADDGVSLPTSLAFTGLDRLPEAGVDAKLQEGKKNSATRSKHSLREKSGMSLTVCGMEEKRALVTETQG